MDGIEAWRGARSQARLDEGSKNANFPVHRLHAFSCPPLLSCTSLVSCAASDPGEAVDDVIVGATVSGVAVATSVG